MANTNNQDGNSDNLNQETDARDDKTFDVSDKGQNLGGGKGDEKTINVGTSDDNLEFSKTDQSISQAAPGQTATNTNQGGSNA